MGHTKRAIEDIQAKGWPVDNDSLKRLVKERVEDCEITISDILSVANDLTIGITDAQIDTIKKLYQEELADRPHDNWRIIVEDLIYSLKS